MKGSKALSLHMTIILIFLLSFKYIHFPFPLTSIVFPLFGLCAYTHQECMQRYMASGRAQKDIDFSKDDALLAALGQSVAAPQPVAASSSFW